MNHVIPGASLHHVALSVKNMKNPAISIAAHLV